MEADWAKIKIDYISGSDSLRTIAKKYDVPVSTVTKRSRTDSWVQARADYRSLVEQETAERAAKQAADEAVDRLRRIREIVEMTEDVFERLVKKAEEIDNPKDLNSFVCALERFVAVKRDVYDIEKADKNVVEVVLGEEFSDYTG